MSKNKTKPKSVTKPAAKAKPKALIFLVVLLPIILTALAFVRIYLNQENAEKQGNEAKPGSAVTEEASPKEWTAAELNRIKEIPGEYFKEGKQPGTLTEITYETKVNDGSGRTATKKAMVYLPHNYSQDKEYNTFYLLHGYGGSYQTFFGSAASPRALKTLLDNMIAQGELLPTIVVTPGYTEEYTDYYQMQEELTAELTQVLVPLVEGQYSTYAKTTDAAGLMASRSHRGIGGFSMGGCTTWRALKNQGEFFQYYLPTSMPMYYDDNGYVQGESARSAKEILQGLRKKGEAARPVYVFAASGSEDFMSRATEEQVNDLCSKANGNEEEFTYTEEGFDQGNILFHSFSGRKHSFNESLVYFYNGLSRFYR